MSDSCSQENESAMCRPSLTIRERHDKLLDELAAKRYASRSEAARAAIEELSESVIGSGRTNIDQLNIQVTELTEQIENLADQLDLVQDEIQPVENRPTNPTKKSTDNQSEELTSAVDVTNSSITELADEIYSLLIEQNQLTISELSTQLPQSKLEINETLEYLVNQDFVVVSDNDGEKAYKMKEIGNN